MNPTSAPPRQTARRAFSIALSAAFSLSAALTAHAASELQWKCSTAESVWTDKPAVPMDANVSHRTESADHISVDSKRRLQTIDGWGGCFNERGWKAMEVLSPAERDALLHNLFDAKDGLKLSLCRTPIGASDYAITLYSLNETPGDYTMEKFSIERDQERLIPYIKAAMAIRPDLKLWAVPWSPPSWMKDNNNLIAGNIKDDDKTLDALALYFARYVQAYKESGVNISMVMPQNEPSIASNYTSCLWTGAQLAKFIGYHLGPLFEKQGLDTKIFLGTIQNSKKSGYANWVAPSMQDPAVRKYISGVGCQWDADTTMAETHFLFPEMKLMQTETECGKPNTNDWNFADYQYQLARKWFAAGASANIIWNLVLDETGQSTAKWAQCSPVVVDSQTKKVTYTPFYYCYKHFSYFVQPGASLLHSQSTTWGERVAFVNPDGSVAIVMANLTDKEAPVALNIDGKQAAPVSLPPHSFNTFTLASTP